MPITNLTPIEGIKDTPERRAVMGGRMIAEDGNVYDMVAAVDAVIGELVTVRENTAADTPHTVTIASGVTAALTKMGGVTLATSQTLASGDYVYLGDVISTAGTVTGATALGGGLYRVDGADVAVSA